MPRIIIEKELSRLSIAQLDEYVQAVCEEPLSNFVGIDQGMKVIVTRLITELIRMEKEKLFFKKVSESVGNMDLVQAINQYLERIPDGLYNALVMMNGRPFVDRQNLRPVLNNLFNIGANYYRILLINGSRYTGRSHSNLLIQHLAQANGFLVKKIDLLDVTRLRPLQIEDLILKFVTLMEYPNGYATLKDSEALPSAKATRLADFIVNWLGSNPGGALRHWCFVFDSYDRDEVLTECREFINDLMIGIVDSNVTNAWVVVLGHNPSKYPIFPNLRLSILDEQINPLTSNDIQTYLSDLATSRKQLLHQDQLDLIFNAITKGLNFPLNKEQMGELEMRLTEYIRTN